MCANKQDLLSGELRRNVNVKNVNDFFIEHTLQQSRIRSLSLNGLQKRKS